MKSLTKIFFALVVALSVTSCSKNIEIDKINEVCDNGYKIGLANLSQDDFSFLIDQLNVYYDKYYDSIVYASETGGRFVPDSQDEVDAVVRALYVLDTAKSFLNDSNKKRFADFEAKINQFD